VVVILFAATALASTVGVALIFPNRLLDRLWELNRPAEMAFRALGRISGLVLLLIAAGTLTCGVAMLRRRRWAWWFAVVMFALSGGGDLVSFGLARNRLRSAAGVLICSAFLCLLDRDPVRRYFEANDPLP
jgi:hypothetical protein